MSETSDPYKLIAELEAKLATAEDRAAGWDSAAAIAQERIAYLEARLVQITGERDRAVSQIRQLWTQKDELVAERDRIREVARTAQDQREQSRKAYAELRHAHAELEDQRGQQIAALRAVETERDAAVARLDAARTALGA